MSDNLDMEVYEVDWTLEEVRDADDSSAYTVSGGSFRSTERILNDVPTRRDGFYGRWSQADGLRPPEYDDQPKLEDFDVQCCTDPKPRISEASGRLFCGSCKRYLDGSAAEPQLEENDGDAEAGNAGSRQESDDGT